MTDDIRRALALAYSVGRDAYASGGVAHLLPSHLGQALAIQGVGRYHNPLSARPHFDDGGDSSSGSDNSNGGIGNGGWSDGTGGFGFGGIDTSGSSSRGAPGTSNDSGSSSGGFGSGAPAGSSTGGYGGLGGYGSSASVGGSYGGDASHSYSSSHVSSAPSNDSSANSGAGSIGGAFGGYSSGDAFGSNNGGFGGVTGAPGTSAGFGQNGFAGGALGGFNSTNTGNGVGFTSGTNAFGGLNSGAVAGSAGPESTSDASAYSGDFGSFLAKMGIDSNDPGFKSSMENAISALAGTAASGWTSDGYAKKAGQDIGATSYATAHDVPDGMGFDTSSTPSLTVTPGVLSASPTQPQATISNEAAKPAMMSAFGSLPGVDKGGFANASDPVNASGGYGTFESQVKSPSFEAGVNSADALATPGLVAGPALTTNVDGPVTTYSPASVHPAIQAAMFGHTITGDVGNALAGALSRNAPSADQMSMSSLGTPGLNPNASTPSIASTPQSLSFGYSDTGTPATIGNERALTVFGNSYSPNAAAYAGAAAPVAQSVPTMSQDVQTGVQKGLEAAQGTFGSTAAGVFGLTPDQMTSVLSHPEAPESQALAPTMVQKLNALKAEVTDPNFSSWAHPIDNQVVQHMMAEGGYSTPGAAIDATIGFVNNLAGYGKQLGSYNAHPAASTPTTTDSGWADHLGYGNIPAGTTTASFGMNGLAGASLTNSDSTDPSQVDGVRALTVHNPSFDGSGFSTDAGAYPGNIGALQSVFSSAEQANGLPAGYLSKTATIESTGNPNARNGQYQGEFQFGDDAARQYSLANRYDPVESANAAAALAADNARQLKSMIGRDPSGAETYLAHQQGAAGAASLLSNPNENAVAALVAAGNKYAAQSVTGNGGSTDMTAGQFASMVMSKYDNAGSGPAALSTSPDWSASPDGTLATAMNGLQGLGYGGDEGSGLASALAAAYGVTNGALPSFAGADHILSQSDPTPSSASNNAPSLTVTPSTPSSVIDAAGGTYGVPESFEKVPGWVTMGLPVIGAGRSLMTLLGGQPAGVDDPSMTRAEGTGSSAPLDGPQTLQSTATTGGGQAASSSSSSSDTDQATKDYLALLAKLAKGNGQSSIYVPAISISSSNGLVAPTSSAASFYNPMTDPVVTRALYAAGRA